MTPLCRCAFPDRWSGNDGWSTDRARGKWFLLAKKGERGETRRGGAKEGRPERRARRGGAPRADAAARQRRRFAGVGQE